MNKRTPSRFLYRLRHTRIENKGLKLLSLLLAVLLFAVAQQPITDLRMVGVPIEYRGLNPGVEISGDVEQTVSVRLRGPRDIVRSLIPNQLLVVADLSNKEPGERIVQLRADESYLPNSVKVLQIEPASIRIRLEHTVRKRVEVEAQFSGQVEEGREIYRVRLTPKEVEIEGPESLVNQVERVMTETVNLHGRKTDFQMSVEVEAPQNSLRVKTPDRVNLSIEIGERRLTRRLANLPVHWPDKGSTGRLLTKTVDVDLFGPKSAVEALRPDDLRVEINPADLTPGVLSIAPRIHLPASTEKSVTVKNVIPKEVKVKK